MIYLYSENIEDPEMDEMLMKVIDDNCEENREKTNIKAGMTGWYMKDHPGFDTLANYMTNIAKRAAFTRYNHHWMLPEVDTMWGAKYGSDEYTLEHRHYPSLWSCIYYPNTAVNAPPLVFIDEHNDNEETEIPATQGLLLCFESSVKHRVDPKKFEGYRYVVSANINHNWVNG